VTSTGCCTSGAPSRWLAAGAAQDALEQAAQAAAQIDIAESKVPPRPNDRRPADWRCACSIWSAYCHWSP
jgi:hypothetical protein